MLAKLLLIASALDQEVRGDLPGRNSADPDAEIPLVSSYYRALGNLPNFLDAVWQRIEARVGSETHEQRRDALIAQATAALAGMSAPAPDMSMLPDEQQAEVRAILAAFRRWSTWRRRHQAQASHDRRRLRRNDLQVQL